MSKVVAASKISRKPARRIAFYASAMSEALHTRFGGSERARTVLLYCFYFACPSWQNQMAFLYLSS